MSLKDYEERAKQTDELIKLLSSKVEELEKKLNLSGPTSNSKSTVLKFKDANAAVNYVNKNDKFWLFNETWKGMIKESEIFVQYYEPLSDSDLKKFESSKSVLPERLCRFDQYFSKQMKQKENRFQPELFTISHNTSDAKKEQPKKEEKKDDDFDLFGSDDEEDEEYEQNLIKKAQELEERKRQQGKVKPIAKSAVVLDVKPWDDETDLKEMEKLVRAIEMDGLDWKASKLIAIGYGIKKLQISCHIVDDKVSVDDIQEKIESHEDFVQSVDVNAFSKL